MKDKILDSVGLEIFTENMKKYIDNQNTGLTTDEVQELIDNSVEDLTTHTEDTTVHITSTERTDWNKAKTHADSTHTIEQGGTGATTARAAEYNINGGIAETTTAVSDSSTLVFKYSAPSSTQGVFLYKKASLVWNYIKSKISSVLGLTETNYSGNANTATTASKLSNTSDIGSETNPVYFNASGVPVKTTHTLESSVPSDAKFTDTTYSNFVKSGSGAKAGLVPAPSTTAGTTKYLREDGQWVVPPDNNTTYSEATTSKSGLMSSTDKTKLDATNIAYGTCSTDAATAEKVITISGNTNWALTTGSMITIKFSYTNNASNPTFNVNGTGAKSVWYNTAVITTSGLSYAGTANRPMNFVYNGTQYVFIGWSIDSNTTYNNATLGQGYGTCSTASATTAKVVTLSSYSLTTGGIVAVKFTYDVPASATMNINSKGAKAIYYRGSAITAGVIKAGDIATFIYNGSQYHLLTLDRDVDTTYDLSSFGITATADELNYVDGVTSNIQTQLNNKAPSSHGAHVNFSTTAPVMNGTASVGSATTVSRSDHVHPVDTSRAPKSHASTQTTYGAGNASNYGHVKLSDSYTSSGGAAQYSICASSKAVADCYTEVMSNITPEYLNTTQEGYEHRIAKIGQLVVVTLNGNTTGYTAGTELSLGVMIPEGARPIEATRFTCALYNSTTIKAYARGAIRTTGEVVLIPSTTFSGSAIWYASVCYVTEE